MNAYLNLPRIKRFFSKLYNDPVGLAVRLRNHFDNSLGQRSRKLSLRRENIPKPPYSQADQAIMDIPWVHRIPLPDGRVTPGCWDTAESLARLDLPLDLSGRTVLDVGTWDGYYAFEAERRGALRVLATDHYCWTGEGWGTRAGFDLAHQLLDSKVEALDIDIPDISPESVGMFDVVMFLGVLYHLKEPFAALERVASVTGQMLILETMVDLTFMRQPALTFHRGRSQPFSFYRHWRTDPGTWFAPNEAAVVTMLEQVGFKTIKRVYPANNAAGHIVHFCNTFLPLFNVQKNYRMVFHAWK